MAIQEFFSDRRCAPLSFLAMASHSLSYRAMSVIFIGMILFHESSVTCQPLLTFQEMRTPIDVTVETPVEVRSSSGWFVETSPGLKPGELIRCIRLRIPGVSRIRNMQKYANSFRVKVELLAPNTLYTSQKVDVCCHGNYSLGLGQCPKESWKVVEKGSWNGIISPFEVQFLELRIRDAVTDTRFIVSVEEEFWAFRLAFLTCGVVLLLAAPLVSSWVPFYYSSAMMLGIVLIILLLLFQGMKLLPTGRKSSLYIVLYGSVVGLGTVLLHYFSGLAASISKELGISSEAYNPVAIFLVLGIGLMGAWLGYWGVRKMVLSEDGTVDTGTAEFVKWAIRIVGSVMILQSSHDPLLSVLALVASFLFCWIINKLHLQNVVNLWDYLLCFWQEQFSTRDLYRFQRDKSRAAVQQFPKPEFLAKDDTALLRLQRASPYDTSPVSFRGYQGSPINRLNKDISNKDYYSTFHNTPASQRMSPTEWNQATKQHTKSAIQELAASPKFAAWFAKNAERVMILPNEHREDRSPQEVQGTAYMPQVDEDFRQSRPRCWGLF